LCVELTPNCFIVRDANGQALSCIRANLMSAIGGKADFDVIEDEKVPKDMLDLAVHVVNTKKASSNRKSLKTSTKTL